MKNLSSICFGCEPLGGTDSGDVDLGEIKKAIYKYDRILNLHGSRVYNNNGRYWIVIKLLFPAFP